MSSDLSATSDDCLSRLRLFAKGASLTKVLAVLFLVVAAFFPRVLALRAPALSQHEVHFQVLAAGNSLDTSFFDGTIHSLAEVRALRIHPGDTRDQGAQARYPLAPMLAEKLLLLQNEHATEVSFLASTLRWISVLFASLSVLVFYALSRVLFVSSRRRFISTACFATSPLLTLFSREAGESTAFLCFSLVATCFLMKEHSRSKLAYVISVVAALYTSPLVLLLLLAHATFALCIKDLRRLMLVVVSAAVAALVFFPWVVASKGVSFPQSQHPWEQLVPALRHLFIDGVSDMLAWVVSGLALSLTALGIARLVEVAMEGDGVERERSIQMLALAISLFVVPLAFWGFDSLAGLGFAEALWFGSASGSSVWLMLLVPIALCVGAAFPVKKASLAEEVSSIAPSTAFLRSSANGTPKTFKEPSTGSTANAFGNEEALHTLAVRSSRGLAVALLVITAGSSAVVSFSIFPWTKAASQRIDAIAQALVLRSPADPRVLLVAESDSLADLLLLSGSVPAETETHLIQSASDFSENHGTDREVFLLSPSDALRARAGLSGRVEPVAGSDGLVLFRVRRSPEELQR